MENKNLNNSRKQSSMMSRRYSVTIVEQPAKTHRFRYASEIDKARSVGSIPGVNDQPPHNRTYPTIRVEGYSGPMLVLLCLVNPHDNLVHPHDITGKPSCGVDDKRYCSAGIMVVYTIGPEVSFNNIGILCVKGKSREDIKYALKLRATHNIDPFRKGFPHMKNQGLINLAAVRLCFNVFLPAQELTKADRFNHRMYTQPLDAVMSDIIYDVKKLYDMQIKYLIECSGSMRGGTKIVLLCKKYNKDSPPEVVFSEPGWMAKANVTIYHEKTALVIETPPYRDPECSKSVQVEVYLQNTDGVIQCSNRVEFMYIPETRVQRPRRHPPAGYIDAIREKRTLLEEYFGGNVPYPQPAVATQFLEIPPPKQEIVGASPSPYSAQPLTPDCRPQQSTSRNQYFLPQHPQPNHLLKTQTNMKENVIQTLNEPNHLNPLKNVTSESDKNIYLVSPDYLHEASTSFIDNRFCVPNYTLENGNVPQNSVPIPVMPNVVTDNTTHYDQTPDLISGANGGEIREDVFPEEDDWLLYNNLLDIKNPHPFVSDADVEMLSGELKNLQCQNDDAVQL